MGNWTIRVYDKVNPDHKGTWKSAFITWWGEANDDPAKPLPITAPTDVIEPPVRSATPVSTSVATTRVSPTASASPTQSSFFGGGYV